MTRLALHGGTPELPEPVVYGWPKVTPRSRELVIRQLESGKLSIYDKSGVVREFEDRFAEIHGRRHGLVTSSGTAALHSCFYGLGVGPGDEIVCPSYTFFATATPLFQMGALPVLTDVTPEGLFCAEAAEATLTERTRGVVVTHMWGLPCDLPTIARFCEERGLFLVEDCSHAHGASVGGRHVGAYGAAAAWSLQTQKIVAAGEGGILLTDSREVYDRAQLLGHFNKRSQQEMDPEGPLYGYSSTGLGLKYRAHPLGIAFAVGQLDSLEEWIQNKQDNARRIDRVLRRVPGYRPLGMSDGARVSAYYAFAFLVDEEAGIDRDEFVRACVAEGFRDMDVPKATAGLHTYKLFQDPVSPVFDYEGNCLRGAAFPTTDRIMARSVKVSVPVEPYDAPDSEARRFVDGLEAVVDKVCRGLTEGSR